LRTVRSDVLFRLHGAPVYVGTLAAYTPDPDTPHLKEERIGIVLDFVWDDECRMHLVHFLYGGEILILTKGDLRLP